MTEPVPMVDLRAQFAVIEHRVRGALDAVLSHGQFVLGPEVAQLEAALRARTGATTVACANGTDALVLALRALGIRPGDRVVVPAFTFAATAEAVALVGGVPVFADVDDHDFNIDVDALARGLRELDGPTPIGVIAVDLFGQPADHRRLAELTAAHGCWLVVDAAQSLGAARSGVPAGGAGTLATTSFFPSKPLACYGDGGAVFCRDSATADLLRSLGNHGAGRDRYENIRIGTNSRLDTVQAAVLLQKLSIFDDELARRAEIAARYAERLGDVVVTPQLHPGATSTWAQYTIRTPARDRVVAELGARGIAHAVHYRSTVADQPPYAEAPTLDQLPVARRLCREVVSLPMHPYLSSADQDRVVEAVWAAVRRSA